MLRKINVTVKYKIKIKNDFINNNIKSKLIKINKDLFISIFKR